MRTRDANDTRALAASLASLVEAGDVVSLSGDLGAGKTCFVQGAARALGVTRRVTSPTFLLVRLYDEASPPVCHCDVYRLDRTGEMFALGDDVLGPDYVSFVEWGDAIESMLPDDRLELVLAFPSDDADGASEQQRDIVARLCGAWGARRDPLAAAWSAWLHPSAPPC